MPKILLALVQGSAKTSRSMTKRILTSVCNKALYIASSKSNA
jgi:hypothetical protein